MSIRPNTTCDVYRAGNAPPSAPDVAAVPCCFVSCFDQGREHGEKEAQQFRFTAKMLVAPTGDVRDNFNAWTGSASSRDTVYLPDWTGTGYNVNFVERINRGLASDALCVYLDRLAITWPYPGPAVLAVSPNFGPLAGGTSVTLTGRGFTSASAVNFGATAATSFTVNSATQITAVSPAESAGQVDVTVTTPLGTSSANVNDQFTFQASSMTYTTPGTYTWNAPAGVSSVSVACWGGGMSGDDGALSTGAGGNGGYYEYNSSVAVTAGDNYTVVVADGGAHEGYDGGNSTFTGDSVTVTGYGGGTGSGGTYSGGLGGGDGSIGGGGGSSAGTASNGNDGADGNSGGAGGAAVTGGGTGGNGSSTTANGGNGGNPGGGGGGGSGQGSSVGGSGGSGQVILTWT